MMPCLDMYQWHVPGCSHELGSAWRGLHDTSRCLLVFVNGTSRSTGCPATRGRWEGK